MGRSRQNACAVGCAVSSKPTHARRLYAFVRLVRKVIQRRRLLGIRLIWRLGQQWLFGALRVGGCSCVGGRWFGGFVCFRGQMVEHGIAPEERCPKSRLSSDSLLPQLLALALHTSYSEMMRLAGVARWSQLTIVGEQRCTCLTIAQISSLIKWGLEVVLSLA